MKKHIWAILLLLDGFALGGLATLFLISKLIRDKCCVGEQFDPVSQTLYNLFDDIFPYKIFFAAMFCVVVLLTMFVWLVGRSRRTAID